ncbi:MAG TPA: TauD/TfdA family dioxygenase [Acidimicrobiales bacterium]
MGNLTVRNITPSLGAEIRGLEPQVPLDDDTIGELRELFDTRSVLVFPEMDIDEKFQKYLCYTLIGAELLEAAPANEGPDEPEPERPTFYVSNRTGDGAGAPYGRLLFHCDAQWARSPQPVISLYGVEVEDPNVPTMFVSMGDAWDSLPDDLRTRVEGLNARHGYDNYYPNRGGDDDVIDAYYEESRSTITPIANPHPRTGRTGLYVSEQATLEIKDMEPDDYEQLLTELFEHLYAEENVLRHDWHQNDLVVWDNCAVQHARAKVALDGPARTLRKVTGPLTLEPDEVQLPSFSKLEASPS